ncbi:uncharacterized protein [Asterias amurensis]|uniref:uncharacterized protein n=1 Tax=Asterias amurensis TaxID=7602 RepID=UPI003AB7D00A
MTIAGLRMRFKQILCRLQIGSIFSEFCFKENLFIATRANILYFDYIRRPSDQRVSTTSPGRVDTVRAERPPKGRVCNVIRKFKRASCLCEPDVVPSEIDLNNQVNGGPVAGPTASVKVLAHTNPNVEIHEDHVNQDVSELKEEVAIETKPPSKKSAKRAEKKAAKQLAQQKEKERREVKEAERQRKKAAKRYAKNAAKEKEKEKKAQRRAGKSTKKHSKKVHSPETSSSGRETLTTESMSDHSNEQGKKPTCGLDEAVDNPHLSASSDYYSASSSSHDPTHPGCFLPVQTTSPSHRRVTTTPIGGSLDSQSADAVPSVEDPVSTDDVAGMSYRSERHSPVTVHQQSRASSPSPSSSSVTRASPAGTRTPRPPSGHPRTDYTPSLKARPPSWRAVQAGNNILDNNQGHYSRYGEKDVNANLRVKSPPSKPQHQTRQQPVRAVHPQTEVTSHNPPFSRRQLTTRRFHSIEDLYDGVDNLQFEDTSGSLSPGSSTASRRSSYSLGQRARVGSADLKCPPIPGASPPERASHVKVTGRGSSTDSSSYEPTFAYAAQPSASAIRIPSVSRNASMMQERSVSEITTVARAKAKLQERSNSEGDKDRKLVRQSRFSSAAQHSVLGTGRTGNNSSGFDKGGLVGLINLGNTCYMNSILQCLAQIGELKDYLLSGDYLRDINRKSAGEGNLIKGFADLMKQLWEPKKRESVAPNKLHLAFQKISKQFRGSKQQDAQEFLRYLLSELHDETNTAAGSKKSKEADVPDDISEEEKAEIYWERYRARDNSIFSRIFVGQLKSTLECQTCKSRSVTFDIFWDLSVPVPERKGSGFQRRTSWDRENPDSFDIKDCLNKFTEAEVLDGENMVTCDKCKKKCPFIKWFSIQRFPKHLVLHLKRFSGLRSKLTTHINFPVQGLDMTKYCSETTATRCMYSLSGSASHIEASKVDMFQTVWKTYSQPPLYDWDHLLEGEGDLNRRHGDYNLGGVSQHSGSMLGGHYIAYAKHLSTSKWHIYDDSRVDTITETNVPSSYAYVLFYQQAM